MNKIFEHVKDNQFKLCENLRDPKRTVTKIEEDEVLQYIRKILIPIVTNDWNKGCVKRRTAKFRKCSLTPDEVSKSLKKAGHFLHSPSDKTTTDVVLYKSDISRIPLKGQFEFRFFKQLNGQKIVEIILPDGELKHHYIGNLL